MRAKIVQCTVPPHPCGHGFRPSVYIKARIAAYSRTIGKIRNGEVDDFGLTAIIHELIRAVLGQEN